MESSMVSSPRNSGVSEVEEEASPEESTWTEFFADYDARREEEMSNTLTCSMTMSSASMVSDAGSGPHWKLRNYNNSNNMTMMMMNNSMPKRLNLKRAKETPYVDDSLEDTASSPVNSPKITTGFKRMEINCRRPADDTFDTSHGKGRALDARLEEYQVLKAANSINGVDEPGKESLAEKGFCLVPYTTLMNFNYYHLPR